MKLVRNITMKDMLDILETSGDKDIQENKRSNKRSNKKKKKRNENQSVGEEECKK